MKQYTVNGTTYKQVRKDTARKLYITGKPIALLQCKANPFCAFNNFLTISANNTSEILRKEQFDSCVNSYEYYNCNNELGKYANFFVVE